MQFASITDNLSFITNPSLQPDHAEKTNAYHMLKQRPGRSFTPCAVKPMAQLHRNNEYFTLVCHSALRLSKG